MAPVFLKLQCNHKYRPGTDTGFRLAARIALRPPPTSPPHRLRPLLCSHARHDGESASGRSPRDPHLRLVPPRDVRPDVPDEGAAPQSPNPTTSIPPLPAFSPFYHRFTWLRRPCSTTTRRGCDPPSQPAQSARLTCKFQKLNKMPDFSAIL